MKKTLTAVLVFAIALFTFDPKQHRTTIANKVDTKASAETTVAVKKTTIQREDDTKADSIYAGIDSTSHDYNTFDFAYWKSNNNLTIIENFNMMQQTTRWSYGSAKALIVAHSFGNPNGIDSNIVDVRRTKWASANRSDEYGTLAI